MCAAYTAKQSTNTFFYSLYYNYINSIMICCWFTCKNHFTSPWLIFWSNFQQHNLQAAYTPFFFHCFCFTAPHCYISLYTPASLHTSLHPRIATRLMMHVSTRTNTNYKLQLLHSMQVGRWLWPFSWIRKMLMLTCSHTNGNAYVQRETDKELHSHTCRHTPTHTYTPTSIFLRHFFSFGYGVAHTATL